MSLCVGPERDTGLNEKKKPFSKGRGMNVYRSLKKIPAVIRSESGTIWLKTNTFGSVDASVEMPRKEFRAENIHVEKHSGLPCTRDQNKICTAVWDAVEEVVENLAEKVRRKAKELIIEAHAKTVAKDTGKVLAESKLKYDPAEGVLRSADGRVELEILPGIEETVQKESTIVMNSELERVAYDRFGKGIPRVLVSGDATTAACPGAGDAERTAEEIAERVEEKILWYTGEYIRSSLVGKGCKCNNIPYSDVVECTCTVEGKKDKEVHVVNVRFMW